MNAMIDRPERDIPIRFLLTALLLLATLAILSPLAAAQENGVITGTVINQTTGEPEPNLTVTLTKFADQTGTNSEDTTTDAADDGSFTFDNLDTSDGLAYAVSVRFMGVLYSTIMILLSDESQQQVTVDVYETTSDQNVISIPTRGLIVSSVQRETGILSLTDAYTFDVAEDRTVVEGADGYSVRFPVPENVDQITPRPGFNFGTARVEETDVLVTTPLQPGQTNAGLDYEFEYTGESIEIPVTAGYPTDALQILVPTTVDENEILVDAGEGLLLDGGPVSIGEREYHRWSVDGLESGETLSLTFSGLPQPPRARQLSTLEPGILAGLALLIASIVTGWIVLKRGLHHPRPAVLAPAVAAPLDQQREELSAELHALEAAWGAGELDENEYRISRRAILEDLRLISRQYRGIGADE